jgi:hypothetical protein
MLFLQSVVLHAEQLKIDGELKVQKILYHLEELNGVTCKEHCTKDYCSIQPFHQILGFCATEVQQICR